MWTCVLVQENGVEMPWQYTSPLRRKFTESKHASNTLFSDQGVETANLGEDIVRISKSFGSRVQPQHMVEAARYDHSPASSYT
ncbi:hypothetical protein M3J09_011947 [Ascochyta lentis]